jgi:outer membrane lipoprotein carrier protein
MWLLLTYLCWELAALSADPNPKLVAAKLETRYRAAHTLQATFLERYSENGQLTRSEAGTAYFRRPGKMRWEYESPEKNLFLVDGKTAWFYVPADRTVTRAPAKQSEDWRTPLALLAGEMKLSRVCARVELASKEIPENPADVVLHCQLKGDPAVSSSDAGSSQVQQGEQAVYLEVSPDTGELARVLISEKGGVSIDFKFGGWRFDPPLPDSFFHFDPPRGVVIVDGETPAQSKP